MKIGFTDGNRNIYELKKQNSIKFGQSNAISQKKTVVQKDSDDKKKTDKNQNMGKIALAVTVPTLVIGGALAAYYISKGKKKTINASKIVPKAEKEITKNDLLKDSKEVSKILKVFVAPNNGTPLKLSKDTTEKVVERIEKYQNNLGRIFTEQVAQKISPHLVIIINTLSTFLNNKTEEKFEVNGDCQKAAQAALNEINNFVKLLQRYDSLDLIKNKIKEMITKKPQRKTAEVQQPREQALKITNDAQIKAHTINTQANFDYKFKEKNINKAQFVLDSNGKKYLVFENTSGIIPNETKKKQSGFTIEGMGDSRFFAIALDGISCENLLNMIKNPEVLKQFNGESATEEAQEFFLSTLQELDTNTMAELVRNKEVWAETQVVEKYVEQKIAVPSDEADSTAMEKFVEGIAQNQDQQLTLLLICDSAAERILPEVIDQLSIKPKSFEEAFTFKEPTDQAIAQLPIFGFLKDEKKKETLRQSLIQNLEQSDFKDKTISQESINKLRNIEAMKALKEAGPKDLISKYHALLEKYSEEVSNMDGTDSLFIMNDGSVKKCSADNVGSTTLNALYEITAQNGHTYIHDLQDSEIVYKAGTRISDKEYKESLKFKYKFPNIQTKIKDIVEMSDIFDLSIVKPLLYNMKSALNVEDAYDGLQNCVEKEALRQKTKKAVEEILTKFDASSSDTKEKLETLCSSDLRSLKMTYEYTQENIDDLLSKQSLIDSNTIESFMDQFVLGKFGTKYSKPVYKEIVTLDGQKVENVGYEIQDAMDEEKVVLDQNKSHTSNTKGPNNTFYASIRSAYRYNLSDGKQYTITQLLKNPDMTVDQPGTIMLYRIASSEDASKVEYKQITKEFVKRIEQDPILEALFVYNLDSKQEQEKYFKAKIVNALESNPYNWANNVQNIIHTMYPLDLLSKTRPSQDGKRTITGAQDVYDKFLDGVSGGILYITENGDVLVSPNEKIKPDCYVLTLG